MPPIESALDAGIRSPTKRYFHRSAGNCSSSSPSLKVTLLGTDSRSAQASATDNAEAHNAYLQGHFYLVRRNAEDFRKAIDYYDQAESSSTQLCPCSCRARPEALVFMGDLTGERPTAYPKAHVDAEKAVAIAPIWRRTRAALGFVLCLAEWKFTEGLAS